MSQFLLYFDVFWLVLALLSGGGLGLFGLILIAGSIYGAAGIASEMRNGYRVAVAVSFLPVALRVLVALGSENGLIENLGWVLVQLGSVNFVGNPINAIFQYILIVLLLHSQSREHQKIWFH